MEELIKKVEKIFDTYFTDCVGNRINQWSFRTFKQVVLGEITNYKVNEKASEVSTLRPVEKREVKKAKK